MSGPSFGSDRVDRVGFGSKGGGFRSENLRRLASVLDQEFRMAKRVDFGSEFRSGQAAFRIRGLRSPLSDRELRIVVFGSRVSHYGKRFLQNVSGSRPFRTVALRRIVAGGGFEKLRKQIARISPPIIVGRRPVFAIAMFSMPSHYAKVWF